MALLSTLAPTFSLSFLDNNNNEGGMLFYFPATVNTVALALTRANAIRDDVRALTTAQIRGGSINFPLSEDDGGAAPGQPTDVKRKLFLPFYNQANPRATFVTGLPSPIFTIENAGTDTVNTADPLIGALVTAIQANAVTNRGEALDRFQVPYIDVRQRGGRR